MLGGKNLILGPGRIQVISASGRLDFDEIQGYGKFRAPKSNLTPTWVLSGANNGSELAWHAHKARAYGGPILRGPLLKVWYLFFRANTWNTIQNTKYKKMVDLIGSIGHIWVILQAETEKIISELEEGSLVSQIS